MEIAKSHLTLFCVQALTSISNFLLL